MEWKVGRHCENLLFLEGWRTCWPAPQCWAQEPAFLEEEKKWKLEPAFFKKKVKVEMLPEWTYAQCADTHLRCCLEIKQQSGLK